MSKLRVVLLAIGCAASAAASASAGLTSAGVDQTPNVPQQEPTLAQVEPVTPGTTTQNQPVQTPTTTVNATTAVNAVNAPGAAGAPGSTQDANQAARTSVVAIPLPPPDPSSLPVSVLRPLNKAGTLQPDIPNPSPASAQASTMQPGMELGAHAPPKRTPATAQGNLTRASNSSGVRSDATRIATPLTSSAVAESDAIQESDSSSGGTIFYSGIGIAGLILAISFGLFRRASKEDAGAPGGH